MPSAFNGHFPTYRIAMTCHMMRLGIAISVSYFLVGCASVTDAPTNLDYSQTHTSVKGGYRVTLNVTGDSVSHDRLDQWTLHVETADGVPVNRINAEVTGGMPYYGSGLPTKPRVTAGFDAGKYMVENLRLDTKGWWAVKVTLRSALGADVVIFNVK